VGTAEKGDWVKEVRQKGGGFHFSGEHSGKKGRRRYKRKLKKDAKLGALPDRQRKEGEEGLHSAEVKKGV